MECDKNESGARASGLVIDDCVMRPGGVCLGSLSIIRQSTYRLVGLSFREISSTIQLAPFSL